MSIVDIIKRPFRSFDGTKWVKHYFETSADQVKYGKKDGSESNVQTELAGLESDLSTHNHKYAGSASAGGSATSAVKLDTLNVGSVTQPCYFSGGKPAKCTYTLGKSVPADAKFTDTNTWRSDAVLAAGIPNERWNGPWSVGSKNVIDIIVTDGGGVIRGNVRISLTGAKGFGTSANPNKIYQGTTVIAQWYLTSAGQLYVFTYKGYTGNVMAG